MSDITDLIEEARAVGRPYRQHPYAGLVGRLASALEQAEATAERLHEEDARERAALRQERDEARQALAKIRELHTTRGGSQGHLPDGGYGWIDQVCPQCGDADEYGVEWPCDTYRIARGEVRDVS